MSEPPQIKVSKLDAARRQLETAVRLYFSEADPMSIHTLVSAAYQILADINRVRGGTPMLKDQIPKWVRQDMRKEARCKLNESMNFFKHADRDPDEVLEFDQSPTELLLYDAIRKHRELTGELVPILAVYEAWVWLGPGAGLVKDRERQKMLERMQQEFPNATRSSFLSEALPIFASIKA